MTSNQIKIAKGTSRLISQRVVTTIIGLALLAFISRSFNHSEMGVYGAADVFFRLTTIVGGLGLNWASSRYIPHLIATRNALGAKNTARLILVSSLIPAVVFSVVTFLFASSLSLLVFGSISYSSVFQVLGILAFTAVLGLVISDQLKGLGRFGRLATIRVLGQSARALSTMALIILGLSVASVFIGWMAFYILVTVLGFFIVRRDFEDKTEEMKLELTTPNLRSIMFFSLPLMGFWFVRFLMESVDQIIVLVFLGIEPLGVYTIAVSITMFLSTILGMPIISTLTPGMSAAVGAESSSQVGKILMQSARYASLIYFPIAFLLAGVSTSVVTIIAGTDYLGAALPITIISLGISTFGITSALISAATAIAEPLVIFKAFLLGTIFNAFAGIILTPTIGLIGASIARGITYVLVMMALLVQIKNRIDSKLKIQPFLKIAASSIIAAIFAISVIPVEYQNIPLSAIQLGIGIVAYSILLFLSRTIRRGDLALASSIVPGVGWGIRFIASHPRIAEKLRAMLDSEK